MNGSHFRSALPAEFVIRPLIGAEPMEMRRVLTCRDIR
jgi:hypothetical protein